jgi:hypothetical protein
MRDDCVGIDGMEREEASALIATLADHIVKPAFVLSPPHRPGRCRRGIRPCSPPVAHIGRAGWKDWNVVRYTREGDFVLVTNNASDFRQLYAAQPLHAGLVILIPAVNRELQRRLFKAALDELAAIGEPVNRVLEIDLDGEEVTLTLYDLPPA